METGCQGGQGSPRAVAPGGWMDGLRIYRMYNMTFLKVCPTGIRISNILQLP